MQKMNRKTPEFNENFTLYNGDDIAINMCATDTGPLRIHIFTPTGLALAQVRLTETVPQSSEDILLYKSPSLPEHVKRSLVEWANSTNDGISNWEDAKQRAKGFREAYERRQKIKNNTLDPVSPTGSFCPAVIINRYGEEELAHFKSLNKIKVLSEKLQEMWEGKHPSTTEGVEELTQWIKMLTEKTFGKRLTVCPKEYGIIIQVCKKDPYAHVFTDNEEAIGQFELTEEVPRSCADIVVNKPDLYDDIPDNIREIIVRWANTTHNGLTNWEHAHLVQADLQIGNYSKQGGIK
jgi:hypothetical protein